MTQKIQNQYIYLGGGCFWCIEASFQNLKGVINVVSGYAGGNASTANYQSVSGGQTKHAETCRIQYSPDLISLDILLEVFFLAHDPTQLNQQGNDVGPQYRSIIFYKNIDEKEKFESYIKKLEDQKLYQHVQTEIAPFKKFYEAEKEHQDYFNLNPHQSYCSFIINPKIQKLKNKLKSYYKS